MNEYNLEIKNSYFEYCDIPDYVKTAVDRGIEFNSYMMSCYIIFTVIQIINIIN